MPAYQKIQYRRGFLGNPGTALSSTHSAGKSLPAVNPYTQVVTSANSAPIQMYKEEKGYKISDNNQFAVLNEGEPHSKMYASKEAKPAKLKEEVVTFNMVDTTDYPQEYGMQEVVPDKKMSPEEIKTIHCGPFSRKATGRQEEVENENAPPGKSLFVKDFRWSDPKGLKEENPSRGTWENHFAPVIVQDDQDRGTFETAVHVDHAYFGIYGSKKGQTFRLKTVMADIELSVKRGLLARDVADKLKQGINNYIKNDPIGTDDEYLLQEITKIDEISKSNPDIDQPFREREERSRQFKQKENAFWQLVETGDTEAIWAHIQEQGNLRVSLTFLDTFSQKAKREEKPAVDKKIQECMQRINKALAAESGNGNKANTGVGLGTMVVGAVIAAGIAWGMISFLKQKGYIKR
jgi:hypothetical protein